MSEPVPDPDGTGSRNEPIRGAVLDRLNSTPSYRILFAALFPDVGPGVGLGHPQVGLRQEQLQPPRVAGERHAELGEDEEIAAGPQAPEGVLRVLSTATGSMVLS